MLQIFTTFRKINTKMEENIPFILQRKFGQRKKLTIYSNLYLQKYFRFIQTSVYIGDG